MREQLEEIADHIEFIEQLNKCQALRIEQLLKETNDLRSQIARLESIKVIYRPSSESYKLKALLKDICVYLDKSKYETIHSGSIFHQEIKAILEEGNK